MKEIEILCNLKEKIEEASNKILNFTFDNGEKFEYVGQKKVIDTYYKSETFSDFNPDQDNKLYASFRIRQKENTSYITYKYDHFNEKNIWIYSDELETEVGDAQTAKAILEKLHCKELVRINSIKQVFSTTYYEIILEQVVDLGDFIEIEFKNDTDIKDEDVLDVKKDIQELLIRLGIQAGEELNAGKPELMLKKVKT